ncbi:MAG TPA: DNA recombination/repair protein RecA, partial [Acidimicrobiia bacterium]|nr:DNA recombination/repair protein RecA [Acidimicrobiia bacterium]
IGNRARVKVAKNKVAPPFRMAEFDIMYGKGISREGSLLDVGIDLGIVKKSGAWFTYEGEQLGQGREKAKQFLTENLDLMFEISEKVKDAVGIEEVPVEPEAVDADSGGESPNGRGNGSGSDNGKANGRSSNGKRAKEDAETLEIDS